MIGEKIEETLVVTPQMCHRHSLYRDSEGNEVLVCPGTWLLGEMFESARSIFLESHGCSIPPLLQVSMDFKEIVLAGEEVTLSSSWQSDDKVSLTAKIGKNLICRGDFHFQKVNPRILGEGDYLGNSPLPPFKYTREQIEMMVPQNAISRVVLEGITAFEGDRIVGIIDVKPADCEAKRDRELRRVPEPLILQGFSELGEVLIRKQRPDLPPLFTLTVELEFISPIPPDILELHLFFFPLKKRTGGSIRGFVYQVGRKVCSLDGWVTLGKEVLERAIARRGD